MEHPMTKNENSCSRKGKENKCFSCGTTKNMKGRRYCSIKCRQNLRQKLNMRSGLLQALNTRYATFYFSNTAIIMDVIPHGIKEIFRYTELRTSGQKPAEDFSKMTNMLGNAWWAEEKRTTKKYLASRRVLELAARFSVSLAAIRPKVMMIPTVKSESLNYLEIDKTSLMSSDLTRIIKNAYRRQAKIHHPDAGGHAIAFRKLHESYRELLRWADNPTFISRKGFPDKWFYDGENKKWVQPIPNSK
jgi:hypothetical protein